MKSFKKILEEIDNLYEYLVELRNEYEKKELGIIKDGGLKEQISKEEMKIKFLRNNAKIALFNEIVPSVLDILSKYENKPYGTKTKEKIRQEVKEKINCFFYISDSQTYVLTPVDFKSYSIEFGTKYIEGERKRLLINNKIQKHDFNNLELYSCNRNYVDNIENSIQKIKQLQKDARQKQQELMELCKCHNELIVEDMEHMWYDKYIYENV